LKTLGRCFTDFPPFRRRWDGKKWHAKLIVRRSGPSGPDYAAFDRHGTQKDGVKTSTLFFAQFFCRIAAVFTASELAGQNKSKRI
jgi:hypothetical protein